MKLFSVGKIGIFLTKIDHTIEKRRDGEVQVLVLKCRIHPFTHQLAQAMDDVVRGSLFKRTGNADPHNHVLGLNFSLPVERQDLNIFASPDTEKPTIRFEQVKVSHLHAKIEKGTNAYVCSLWFTLGPVSAKELEYCHAWRTTQRFISTSESEPDLAYEEIGGGEEADDEDDAQPALEMEGEEEAEPVAVGVDRKQHKAISHARKGKKR